MMNKNIKIATIQAEKEEIYRLRYKVYIDEMGGGTRHTEADSVSKQLRDDIDERAYHFYAQQDEAIVASARLALRRDGPLECEEQVEMKRFVPAYPDQISMTSRLTLDRRLRGSQLLKQLACAIYQFGREQGLRFDFIDCHPRLLPLYSRLGYRIYRPGFNHPKYMYVIPMVLVGDDVEYLDRVQSPFLAVASRFPQSTQDHDLLLSTFPDAENMFISAQLDPQAFWDLLQMRLLDHSTCNLLSNLSEEEVKLLVAVGHIVACRPSDRVLSSGDSGREIFLILEGSFQVVAPGDEADHAKRKRILAILARGDVFGEISFLTEGIRCTSVRSMENSLVLILNAKSLDHLACTQPKLACKVFRNLAGIVARRLRDALKF